MCALLFGAGAGSQATPPPHFSPAQSEPLTVPGMRGDGTVLLHNRWQIKPIGRQVNLADLPINLAVHPGSRYAAAINCGNSPTSITLVDLVQGRTVSRAVIDEGYYGLAFAPDGSRLYASGARLEVIHSLGFDQGQITNRLRLALRAASVAGMPAGLVVNSNGTALYVANLMAQQVTRVDLTRPTNLTELFLTNVAATATNVVIRPSNPYPYACVLDEPRGRLYVSLWAHQTVAVFDLASGQVVDHWRTQEHPNEMVLSGDRRHLFVANANRNTVSVFDTATGQVVETLSAALHPNLPPGCTPNSLALSPDDRYLFIASGDVNYLAVFEVSHPGSSVSLGFLPTGQYPTSVRVTPDGLRLLVANSKGNTPKPAPWGPQDKYYGNEAFPQEWIWSAFTGTLSIIDLPSGADAFTEFLRTNTAQVYANSPIRADGTGAAVRPPDSPIPGGPGDSTPIKYVVYIIKENRTYDQILGDMPEGHGDPGLCLFPERVTPNHHQLAREFVLFDNFYCDAELSADGHEWSLGAYASDFVEKLYPMGYGRNVYVRPGWGYIANATLPQDYMAAAAPAEGYLWDRAKEAGLSYRIYGEFILPGTQPKAAVPALQGHFDTNYFLLPTDIPKAERFSEELRRFEAEGDMPRLQILTLPDDHTWWTTPGLPTPSAFLARNDRALGLIVEALSKSRFWAQTAIFVVEDDPANGPDHVDCHRSVAYAISPYTKRHFVDSTMYSTCSFVRTMGLILGFRPLSQFDAAATPAYHCFQATPDLTPYTALPPNVDLNELNPTNAWGAALSLKMDRSRVDAADDRLANEIVWRSIKGANSPMPPPVRAAFVRPLPESEEDEEEEEAKPVQSSPAKPSPPTATQAGKGAADRP